MRWRDLDLQEGWWTIPREHSTNGHPHRVPLAADVIVIINAQRTGGQGDPVHVFCGRRNSLVIDRIGKAGAALSRVLGFEFVGHDLRRTAATRMAASGVPREHLSRVLNQVEGGPAATRVYDRYSYDREKRSALELWAREVAAARRSRTEHRGMRHADAGQDARIESALRS
jgi:integrase